MNDDAVAPVIAIMLILAIIVTFYSVWNTLVIPSMKQSSEVEHLQSVESAFQHFSSDIEKAVALKQDNLIFSEPVQLGGGDVISDPVRSSGSLYVENESKPVYTLILCKNTDCTDPQDPLLVFNSTLVKISYESQNNYWQDQGYRWQYGFINVTKYQTRQTPLQYYNMTDVTDDFINSGSLGAFARSFGIIEATGTGSDFDIQVVNLTTSPDHSFVSSNGFGTLKLVTRMDHPKIYSGISSIELRQVQGNFGNAIARIWNNTLTEKGCTSNINDNDYIFTSPQSSTINVDLTITTIELSAY